MSERVTASAPYYLNRVIQQSARILAEYWEETEMVSFKLVTGELGISELRPTTESFRRIHLLRKLTWHDCALSRSTPLSQIYADAARSHPSHYADQKARWRTRAARLNVEYVEDLGDAII